MMNLFQQYLIRAARNPLSQRSSTPTTFASKGSQPMISPSVQPKAPVIGRPVQPWGEPFQSAPTPVTPYSPTPKPNPPTSLPTPESAAPVQPPNLPMGPVVGREGIISSPYRGSPLSKPTVPTTLPGIPTNAVSLPNQPVMGPSKPLPQPSSIRPRSGTDSILDAMLQGFSTASKRRSLRG